MIAPVLESEVIKGHEFIARNGSAVVVSDITECEVSEKLDLLDDSLSVNLSDIEFSFWDVQCLREFEVLRVLVVKSEVIAIMHSEVEARKTHVAFTYIF